MTSVEKKGQTVDQESGEALLQSSGGDRDRGATVVHGSDTAMSKMVMDAGKRQYSEVLVAGACFCAASGGMVRCRGGCRPWWWF